MGDVLVEVLLQRGQLVGHGLGDALGEELLALEGEQVLLDHAAHDTADVDGLLLLSLESVAVEQSEEELEVLFLARVRRRGHQQQVAGDLAEQLTELEPLGLLQLAAEVVRSHAVRLVDDDQVPLGLLELGLECFVARKLIHAGDQQRVGLEDVEIDVGVDQLVGQQVEAKPELEEQLVLPLLHQTAGGDDEALLHVVAQQQLLDVEAGHDRLARSRVVGQQEAQRGARQELAVHSADLMRERLHVTCRHREHRVEQASQRDPLRLGHQLEVTRGRVERPTAGLRNRQAALVLAEHDLLAEATRGVLVGQLQRVGAVPLRRDDGDDLGGDESLDPQPRLEFLKLHF